MTTHELKTWPEFFAHVVAGTKTFEFRRNDRRFMTGDVLHLREWDPLTEEYTGHECRRRVGYILASYVNGVPYVVLSLLPMNGAAS